MSENTKTDFKTKLCNIMRNILKNIKSISQKVFHGFMSAKTFWSAFAILVILLIISIVVLSIRLHDYTKTDDRSVSLRSPMDNETLNVFAMEYRNGSGEITIKGQDGEKVVAPGAAVEYTLRLRNTDNVSLDYSFITYLKCPSEFKLPIVVRLLDPNDNYIIGNETTWIPLSEISSAESAGTLMQRETAEYVFQWKWPFESGNDEYDSFLGSFNGDRDVIVELSFILHAEANMAIGANGGFFNALAGKIIILFIIFILLAIVITLLLIYIISKIKAKKNEPPTVVDVPVTETVEVPAIVEEVRPAPIVERTERKPAFFGKMVYVNIDTLENIFNSGDRITIGILKNKGIIPQNAKQMKILARASGTLNKAFTIETQGISKNAEVAICKAGGRVIITAPDTGDQKH